MQDEEKSGLRSIERSQVSGIKQSRRVPVRRPPSRRSPPRNPSPRRSPPRSPSRRPSPRNPSPRRSPPPRSPSRRSPVSRSRRKHSIVKILIVLVLVSAVVGIFVTLTLATARLNVVLQSADVQVDGVFSAIRNPAQSNDISYSKLGPFEYEQDALVTNITRERQNTYAKGTIVIYNTNTSGERLDLVNRTRFRTEDGRIYRLTSKQVIPGGKDVAGEFVPGRKEVEVEADTIGTEFNILEKGKRFSIPGLAKYKEFSKSYAISSSKIVGGFRGERFIPNPEEEERTRARLREEIRAALEAKLAETLDTNTFTRNIVFDTGKFVTYTSLENEQTEAGVILREKGVLHAISFREHALAELLSKAGDVSMYDLQQVKPKQVKSDSITMEMVSDDDFDPVSSTEFEFRLVGDARLFWDIDTALFLDDIKGKDRVEVESIRLRDYPQIIRIDSLSIFPSWRKTLPNNKSKIDVVIEHAE